MTTPEAEAAFSFETTTPTLDEQTLSQTPCPRAASTQLHIKLPVTHKLYESIMFSTHPNDDPDQSSFGILPCNLDASLMNFSNNVSGSILLNKSRKHSTLPSIPESPNKMLSPRVGSEDLVNDDVFDDNKEIADQTQDENKENLTQSVNQKSGVRFSISDLSKIEFRDDQISARSSTADSYVMDKSISPPAISAKPGTFSDLFSRHTLDVSAFTEALPVTNNNEMSINANASLKPVVVSNTNSRVEVILPELSQTRPDEGADLNYFKPLGDDSQQLDNISTHSDEFVSGGNFLAVLEKDEEVFNKDTELLIPENQAFGNDSVFTQDRSAEAGIRSSWLTAVNRHDITRPSWFSSEENVNNASRISIGEFIRARTESLGNGPDEPTLADAERPNFGVPLSTSPKSTSSIALLPLPEKPVFKVPVTTVKLSKPKIAETTSQLVQMGAKNESIMSNSAISVMLSDVPLDFHRHELASRFIQGTKAPKANRNPIFLAPISNATKRCDESAIEFSASILPGMSESIIFEPKETVDKSIQASTPPSSSASVYGGGQRSCSPKCSNESVRTSSVGLKPLIADQQDFRQCVSIPSEVMIDTPCCVETTTETVINMYNSSPHWLEGSVRFLRLSCNGEEINLSTQPPVVRVDSSWTMEPKAPHSLKVVFVPPQQGNWEVLLQPFLRHRSASSKSTDTENSRWCPFPPVTIKATAEDVDLSTNPAEVVDFGLLPEECLVLSHILVTNNNRAQLPVRLIIEGNPAGGQGFYFPQENLNSSSLLRSSSSCICKCILGKSCPSAKVPIAFKAPTLPHTGNAIQTISAVLRIELEIPGPAPILKKVALKAFVSPVRLCTLPEDETIALTYPTASSRHFPLANVGAIPLNLELVTDAPQQFTIVPVNIELMPGQEIKVQVLYHPTDPGTALQSFLKIKVIPDGSVYKIAVVGNPYCRPQSTLSSSSGNQLLLQSNRRYIYWGAVGLGQNVPEQFVLRNESQTDSLHLYLKIKQDGSGSDISPFHLVDEGLPTSSVASASMLPGCRLASHCNVTLYPMESRVVKLNFSPRNSSPYSAVLVIRHRHFKQQGGSSSVPGVKFRIPLRGFGGMAVLTFDGLQQTNIPSAAGISVQTSTGLHKIATSEHNNIIQSIYCDQNGGIAHFLARNCGHRAAFVKILASSDKTSIMPLPDWLSVIVQPSDFVLEEGGSCPIKVSIQPHCSTVPAFYLAICYGENLLRHRFCRLPLPLSEHPEDVLLRRQLKLHESFQSDVPTPTHTGLYWPACQADRTQLVAGLKIQWVLIQPTHRGSPFRLPSLRLNSAAESDNNLPHGTFFPLEAEVTFSDITVMHNTKTPSSPPSKEKPSSACGNEGTITVEPTSYNFPSVACGQISKFKITLKSIGYNEPVTVNILQPSAPFSINYKTLSVKPNHYLSVPVAFQPTVPGMFSTTLLFYPSVGADSQMLAVSLQGEAV